MGIRSRLHFLVGDESKDKGRTTYRFYEILEKSWLHMDSYSMYKISISMELTVLMP